MRAHQRLTLLTAGDLPGPSGGTVYHDRVAAASPAVDVRTLPGAWPSPGGVGHDALRQCLGVGTGPVLIDGIVACGAPEAVTEAVRRGRPVWVLLHLPLPAETGLGDPERRRLAGSERAALHAATGVICTSAWAREDLLARYGPLTVHVAEPGADDAPLARGSEPLRLLTIASLTPRKNHLTLLEALGRLGQRDWQAHWVGPEAPSRQHRSRLRAALAASPVAHRIRVTGPLHGELLRREWHAADLLVLPSLAETYGMVVTEALARGIPALVGAGTGAEATLWGAGGAGHRLPGDADGPGHGLPGDAVDPTDPTAVADALDRWLGDPVLRSHRRRLAMDSRADLQPWSRTTALILDIVAPVDR